MDVELRQPIPADVPIFATMLNDAPLQRMVMGPVLQRSLAEAQDWLDRKTGSDDTEILSVYAGGACVGYVQIASIDRANGFGTLGICLLEKDRGSGVGTAAMQQIHAVARTKLGLRKLILTVRADNPAAIALYGGLGYAHAGTWTKHVGASSGGYVDVLLMECFLGSD